MPWTAATYGIATSFPQEYTTVYTVAKKVFSVSYKKFNHISHLHIYMYTV